MSQKQLDRKRVPEILKHSLVADGRDSSK